MRTLALLAALAGCIRSVMAADAPAPVSLFNGTNLQGWTVMNGGRYTVTNDVLRLEGGKGWLRTDASFTNFVLELEWRGLETNFNSGIFVRAPMAGNPWASNVWQVNLKQSAVGELLEGSRKAVPVEASKAEVGAWTKFRLEARGQDLALTINDRPAWKFSELPVAGGCLGLQAEGKAFEFRNLTVTPLP